MWVLAVTRLQMDEFLGHDEHSLASATEAHERGEDGVWSGV